jgi:serine/threonine-protein phosphatase 2B catalytic subunit
MEVCLYLFTLKINFPDQIYLLRGNHESRLLTAHFNFEMECMFLSLPTFQIFPS